MAQRRTLARLVLKFKRRSSSLAVALYEEGGLDESSFLASALASWDHCGWWLPPDLAGDQVLAWPWAHALR